MKVIIIKKCNEGNINDIVDVSDGYGKNFLIRKGYAVPMNLKTINARNNHIEKNAFQEEEKINMAFKTKKSIENLQPVFYLKSQSNKIFGSITRKKLIEFLKSSNIKINDSRNVENIKIESMGKTIVKVNIYKDVVANLTVLVKEK